MRNLGRLHLIQLVLLLAMAVHVSVRIAQDQIEVELECKLIEFVIFRGLKALMFIAYAAILCVIRKKIDAIETISKIDRKIKKEYKATIRMIRFLLAF